MTTLDLAVATGNDDWYYYGTTLDRPSTKLQVGRSGTVNLAFGARWAAAIPKNSTISVAYLTVRCRTTYSATTVNANIYGEAADNAASPTTSAEATGYSKTSAVAWNSIGTWTAPNDYQSPSIVDIIQEIVNRAGWTSGNYLHISLENNGSTTDAYRQGQSYEGSSSYPPRLHVEFTEPAAGCPRQAAHYARMRNS